MGMYTGIRVVGKLKPEWIDKLKTMMTDDHGCRTREDNFWNRSDHPALKMFGDRVSRASFIPYGALAYMKWDDDDPEYNNTIDFDGVWRFQCSLKNYEREIESWMREVVPVIFETCSIEYYYEEWTWSQLYTLNQGRVTIVTDRHIKYGYDDSNNGYWGFTNAD